MSVIDTTALRTLAKAATPMVGKACNYSVHHAMREGHVDFENADLFIASDRPEQDAAYYAAVNPATILALLDEIDNLTVIVEKCRNAAGF